MFELDQVRKEVNKYGVASAVSVLIGLLAAVLILLAIHWNSEKKNTMDSFQDCSWVHTFPGPDNCADSQRMSKYEDLKNRQDIALAASLVLVSALVFVPIIRSHRNSRWAADTRFKPTPHEDRQKVIAKFLAK